MNSELKHDQKLKINERSITTSLLENQGIFLEIEKITNKIIDKNKKGRLFFSLEKAIVEVIKSVNDYLPKDKVLTKDELIEIIINFIVFKIEGIYNNGIQGIIDQTQNNNSLDEKVQIAFKIKCTEEFNLKYSTQYMVDHSIDKMSKVLLNESSNINDKSLETKKKILLDKYKESLHYQELLFNIFENFDMLEKKLLEKLITNIIIKSKEKFRDKSEYCLMNEEIGTEYYEFLLDDFLIIMLRIIKFISNLEIYVRFREDVDLYILFGATLDTLESIAQKSKYEMQLKNYAAFYMALEKSISENHETYEDDIKDENTKLLLKSFIIDENIDDFNKDIPQIYNLDENSVINFPPYVAYEKQKRDKFTLYLPNDKSTIIQCDPELQIKTYELKEAEIKERFSTGFGEYFANKQKEKNNNEKEIEDEKDINDIKDIINLQEKELTNRDNSNTSVDILNINEKNEKSCSENELINISQFRQIDKLRLIYRSLDNLLCFKYLNNSNILINIVFKKNFKAYQEELSYSSVIKDPLNIFDNIKQRKFVEKCRNFYGEKVSFYFLFIQSLIKWTIIPAIMGLVYFIFTLTYKVSNDYTIDLINLAQIDLFDVIKLIICGFVTIWATLFINNWSQEEVKYSYFWGTDNCEVTEPEREDFIPDEYKTFIFNKKITERSKVKTFFKTLFSYFLIILMISLTIFFNHLLFELKGNLIKKEQLNNPKENGIKSYFKLSLLIGSLNSVVIKIMSLIYSSVVLWATDWENYKTQNDYENSLALKLIFFEFINNYISLIYISYFKERIEGCVNNNCSMELNLQIYIVLSTFLALNLLELGLPYFNLKRNAEKYIEKVKMLTGGKLVSCETFSLEQQNLCDNYKTTMNDYIEIIILFGYVCLFSVACPLTPVLVLLLLYVERFVDTIKIFFLSNVHIIEKADGIEIFSIIFKIIYFIGMVNSILYVLFCQASYYKYEYHTKIIIFACVENLILLLMFAFKYNKLPDWFDNLSYLKVLYLKYFYNKSSDALPHHFLKTKTIMSK